MKDEKILRALVVDDEKVIRDFLSRFLTLESVGVETAENGPKAIEKAKKESFDIVFLDVRMPNMDGLQTYIELKKIDPSLRCVMMTGYAVDEILEKAKKLGVTVSIKKPFEIAQLKDIVKDLRSQDR